MKKTAGSKILVAAFASSLLLSGCITRFEESHGYYPDEGRIEKLRPGVHDRSSVESLLGSPSSLTNFRHSTWLYVAQKSERLAFYEKEIVERKVLELTFSPNGILQTVKSYDLEDGQKVAPEEEITETRGNKITVLQQLLGNLGRFNSKSEPGE